MPPGIDHEPLLTPHEVATMFRVDRATVTRWAKTGKLTSIRTLGGHRRYLEAEVRALLAATPEAPPDPLKAPVRSLWPVNITGPSAVVLDRVQSAGLTTVGAAAGRSASELRSAGLSADQVDEVRRVLFRKGLALSGDVLGEVA